MISFLTGLAIGVCAMLSLAAYLWRCNAPLRADAAAHRSRLARDRAYQAKRRAGL